MRKINTKTLPNSKEAERYLREIGDGFNRNLFMIKRSMRRIRKIINIFGE